MQVNGKNVTGKAGMTLIAYLEEAGYRIERIVVERNGEIVSKTAYNAVLLTEADTIEVVSFVGGG